MKREQKVEILKDMNGEQLWRTYEFYSYKFNPIDGESVENFTICKDEIARRIAVADKVEGRV